MYLFKEARKHLSSLSYYWLKIHATTVLFKLKINGPTRYS